MTQLLVWVPREGGGLSVGRWLSKAADEFDRKFTLSVMPELSRRPLRSLSIDSEVAHDLCQEAREAMFLQNACFGETEMGELLECLLQAADVVLMAWDLEEPLVPIHEPGDVLEEVARQLVESAAGEVHVLYSRIGDPERGSG
ncbi:MAG: hypothetical protein NXI31_04225 [bacterium]|nr:hypothetical protein [bacterium]